MHSTEITAETTRAMVAALALPGQAAPALDLLGRLYRDHVGYGMMTIILFNRAAGYGRRVWSSRHDTHPPGANKAILQSDWIDLVLERGQVFVADTVAEFRPHYGDWELLQSMGLLSGANFPVIVNGVTIGSVNLTAAGEGYYTAEKVALAGALAGAATLALLMQFQLDTAG